MCIDFKTSVITLTIGTIFNIIGCSIYQDREYISVSLCWQWVLLMQVFDAIAWKNQNCNRLNKISSRLSYIANITQPIIVYLVGISISKNIEQKFKYIASIFILLYIIQILYQSRDIKDIKCLKPKKNCNNLNYYWWNNINSIGYLIVLPILFFTLYRPLPFVLVNLAVIYIALALSKIFYSCGVASMWCWMVACAPIINMIAYKFISN